MTDLSYWLGGRGLEMEKVKWVPGYWLEQQGEGCNWDPGRGGFEGKDEGCCLCSVFLKIDLRERERKRERERETSSTYLSIHWLILLYALTRTEPATSMYRDKVLTSWATCQGPMLSFEYVELKYLLNIQMEPSNKRKVRNKDMHLWIGVRLETDEPSLLRAVKATERGGWRWLR